MSCPAGDLLAWLGPAISQPNFEVGEEVRAAFLGHDPAADRHFLPNARGRWQADLYLLGRQRLAARSLRSHHAAGVGRGELGHARALGGGNVHEGGHAAHFSNVVMNAPCFSQEFAPTSVALAETQSMFCDQYLSDADWRTRYARDAEGRLRRMSLPPGGHSASRAIAFSAISSWRVCGMVVGRTILFLIRLRRSASAR